MTLANYLKDKAVAISIAAGVLAVMLLFLSAFHAPGMLTGFVLVPYVAGEMAILIWEFERRRSFYDRLFVNLAELDQKYLASEVVPEPSFYEGRLFHEAMYEMGKSMTEQVATSRRGMADFREYIEMWVHEAKLPIASLMLACYNGSFSSSGSGGREKSGNREESGGREDSRGRNVTCDGGVVNVESGGRMTKSQVAEQLRRLDAYTEQVLYYSRSEAAEKDFLIKEVQLRKVVADAVMKFRDELLAKEFSVRTEGLECSVMTDGKWLEFILGQLLSNSLKYCATTGERTISFCAKTTSDQTVLCVKDNGIGITTSDLPRIFDKTFTGENGRKCAKSTGMGLYIVRRLCEKLGHGLSVQSEPDAYTEFQITFVRNDYYRLLD